MDTWWDTKTQDWVYLQELPYCEEAKNFVWSELKIVTKKILKRKLFWQRKAAARKARRQRHR